MVKPNVAPSSIQNFVASPSGQTQVGPRIVIPQELRIDHVPMLAYEGQSDIVNMKKILRAKVWWAGIDYFIGGYCKSCYGCQ